MNSQFYCRRTVDDLIEQLQKIKEKHGLIPYEGEIRIEQEIDLKTKNVVDSWLKLIGDE